jgi:hypothetical protein
VAGLCVLGCRQQWPYRPVRSEPQAQRPWVPGHSRLSQRGPRPDRLQPAPSAGPGGDKSLGVMAPDQPGASLSRRCRSTAKNHSANTAAPVPVTARHEMSRKDAIGTVATSTAKMTASGPEMLAHSQVTP